MNKRDEEIMHIFNVIKNALSNEGYNIPFNNYADGGYRAFDIKLNNKEVEEDSILIKMEYETWR
jgi:hypothetical protein